LQGILASTVETFFTHINVCLAITTKCELN